MKLFFSLACYFLLGTLLVATGSAQTPCYICGGDANATISNPGVNVTFPADLNSPIPVATCKQIYNFAKKGSLSSNICAYALSRHDLQVVCGCSNIDSSNTSTTSVVPAATAPAHSPPPAPTVAASMAASCRVGCAGVAAFFGTIAAAFVWVF